MFAGRHGAGRRDAQYKAALLTTIADDPAEVFFAVEHREPSSNVKSISSADAANASRVYAVMVGLLTLLFSFLAKHQH